AGVVTTLAGSPQEYGSTDGTNSNARFFSPSGVAADTNGNIFVADTINNTNRKVVAAGTNWVVTTIAGAAGSSGGADGTNGAARFMTPFGVAVNNPGNVFVADTDNHTIRKITPLGTNWVVSTIAGQAGSFGSVDGTNKSARFLYPVGL